ncbi:hypothetical protein Tco_0997469 [Tanacetum coccineum]
MLRESTDFFEESVKKSWGKESADESDSEEFMNVFMRIGFGSTIKLVSFNESQMVTFNGKYSLAVSVIVIMKPGVGRQHGRQPTWVHHPLDRNFEEYQKVTEVINVENWQIDKSRVLRWVVSLIVWNSFVLSTKSSIQSTFRHDQALKRSKSSCDGCWIAKSWITCVNTKRRPSHVGFPHRAYRGKPFVDPLQSFLNLGRAGNRLTLSNRGGADVPKALIKPVTHLENWKEMDFRSFTIQGVNDEFNFLPERGFDDNQGSLFTKSLNNETPIIDAEPISTVLPSNVADNIIDSSNTSSDDELPPMHPSISSFPEVGEKSKDARKRKLVADALREGSHHRAQKAHVQVSKVVVDASTPLDVDNDPNIYEFPSARELKDATDFHWVVAHAKYEQTLSILHAKVEGLESERERLKASKIQVLQEIDSLRQDKAAIVSKVVPDIAMKLIHSDEMGVLVSRLVRVVIIHGRCTTFKEVAKLKEPFVLEKMPDYRTSLKDEYD